MSILVSITCMTYNHGEYISDAIEGFLMQKTDFNYEILIGEDCSTDNTKQIVEWYVKQYPEKIRLITFEQNVGPRKNSVRLQKEVSGKYVAICDGDDYWIDPLKLQKQVDYFEANPECMFCFHNAFVVKANKKESSKLKNSLIKQSNTYYYGKSSNYFAGELALLGFIPSSSFMYRKELMDNPPEWYHTAIVRDNSLKLMTTMHGYAHYIDENMGVYRIEVTNSIMDKWKKESANKEKQIFINKGFIELFDHINEYSNYKYTDQLTKSKIPFELQILKLEKRRKELKKAKFKEYFNEVGLREKLKYYSDFYFPKTFSTLVRLKAYV